nr:phage portal protein [Roseivirga pacifica]
MFGNQTRTGISITEAKALALSAVWACIDIKSDVYANMPYSVFRKTKGGKGREEASDHPLCYLLNTRANSYTNAFDFQKAKLVQLLKNGNSYVIPKRDEYYQITALYLVANPNEVTVKEYEDDLYYTYKGNTYRSDEILHYKWFSLDGRIGVNPIVQHKETLGLGLAALFFGADVLGNGAIQPGVLTTEKSLTPEQASSLGGSFASLYGGGLGDKKNIPLLHSGLEYKSHILEPDKAQFLGTKNHIVEEVCRIFNVPPSIVHHHIQSNYNSSEHQDLTFLKYSLAPMLRRVELEDKCKLLTEEEVREGDLYFKHNVNAILRPDYEKRTEGLSKLVNSGIIDRNEARAKEEMDWKEGLDEHLTPVNTMPASVQVDYYQAKIDALKTKGNEPENRDTV